MGNTIVDEIRVYKCRVLSEEVFLVNKSSKVHGSAATHQNFSIPYPLSIASYRQRNNVANIIFICLWWPHTGWMTKVPIYRWANWGLKPYQDVLITLLPCKERESGNLGSHLIFWMEGFISISWISCLEFSHFIVVKITVTILNVSSDTW